MPARQTITVTTTTHSRSRTPRSSYSSSRKGGNSSRNTSARSGNQRRCPSCGRFM